MSEKPLVLVADDGSGRVWIVEDGAGKAWFRPRAAADWVPLKDAKLAGAQDLYDHFASNDPKWRPEAAEMLLTVRALALN